MAIYMKSEEILNYYQKKIADEESGRECVKISQLFSNASIWIARVTKFEPPRVHYAISRDFHRYVHSWTQYAYVANVRRANQWIPSAKESDYCLKLLAGSDTSDGVCLLDDHCSRIVKSGSDIGYALCHRALLLLMARNSKYCSILSPGQDSDLLDSFCSMSYAEAEYIAHHDFGLVDLMLEHISICILHGRTEFLRRSWLNNILEFQTAYGCFSQSITDVEDDNNDLLEGRCSGHTTALATSVLAGAVRYIILEQY
ncbi:uncharacterized protein LOC121729564 [Aricia agestis]|uniref:uncharacterized protein LOC121729564 n=1 Tax=Aricia agestis TaxID=91739 RepID=UPI001C20A303|nr:uncharacterized protein LOC121729564 [Aricia agestis]